MAQKRSIPNWIRWCRWLFSLSMPFDGFLSSDDQSPNDRPFMCIWLRYVYTIVTSLVVTSLVKPGCSTKLAVVHACMRAGTCLHLSAPYPSNREAIDRPANKKTQVAIRHHTRSAGNNQPPLWCIYSVEAVNYFHDYRRRPLHCLVCSGNQQPRANYNHHLTCLKVSLLNNQNGSQYFFSEKQCKLVSYGIILCMR